jgi:putative lipoic acid-binding regulatory protein
MGILAGTTITVTFDARQIAQLDCLLQEVEMLYYGKPEMEEYRFRTQERVDNVYRALHAAGYR